MEDAGQGAVKDQALIGAVGEQFPEKGKQTEQGRQQRETAVAILNVGGGDDAVQQQALRIGTCRFFFHQRRDLSTGSQALIAEAGLVKRASFHRGTCADHGWEVLTGRIPGQLWRQKASDPCIGIEAVKKPGLSWWHGFEPHSFKLARRRWRRPRRSDAFTNV